MTRTHDGDGAFLPTTFRENPLISGENGIPASARTLHFVCRPSGHQVINMNNFHTGKSVLIVGRRLRSMTAVVESLYWAGVELLFADDADEATRMAAKDRPSLVLCYTDLPDVSAEDLCRAFRATKNLSRTNIILIGARRQGVLGVIEAFNAGADDYLLEDSNTETVIAKMFWMLRKSDEEDAKLRQLESLRRRQLQTLEIVRDTTAVFSSCVPEMGRDSLPCADERVELGLSMIAGLANILEQQIKTADAYFENSIAVAARDHRPAVDRDCVITEDAELSLAA